MANVTDDIYSIVSLELTMTLIFLVKEDSGF